MFYSPPEGRISQSLLNGALLVFSGLLYAVALKYFVFPAEIIPTGTEGLAVALAQFFENRWLFLAVYAACQSTLLIFAFFWVSKRFALRSLLVVGVVLSVLPFLPELQFASPEPTNERILLVLFGGIVSGSAKALAFRQRGSTGDEDIVGAFFSMKYLRPVGSIAVLSAIVSTTVGLSLNLIKTQELESVANTLMYTCIYIFVSAETLNNFYKKFQITLLRVFTRAPDNVRDLIKKACPHRTYTMQDALGGYSGQKVGLITVIVTHEELPDLLDALREAPDSFFVHHSVSGVSNHYYIAPIG